MILKNSGMLKCERSVICSFAIPMAGTRSEGDDDTRVAQVR